MSDLASLQRVLDRLLSTKSEDLSKVLSLLIPRLLPLLNQNELRATVLKIISEALKRIKSSKCSLDLVGVVELIKPSMLPFACNFAIAFVDAAIDFSITGVKEENEKLAQSLLHSISLFQQFSPQSDSVACHILKVLPAVPAAIDNIKQQDNTDKQSSSIEWLEQARHILGDILMDVALTQGSLTRDAVGSVRPGLSVTRVNRLTSKAATVEASALKRMKLAALELIGRRVLPTAPATAIVIVLSCDHDSEVATQAMYKVNGALNILNIEEHPGNAVQLVLFLLQLCAPASSAPASAVNTSANTTSTSTKRSALRTEVQCAMLRWIVKYLPHQLPTPQVSRAVCAALVASTCGGSSTSSAASGSTGSAAPVLLSTYSAVSSAGQAMHVSALLQLVEALVSHASPEHTAESSLLLLPCVKRILQQQQHSAGVGVGVGTAASGPSRALTGSSTSSSQQVPLSTDGGGGMGVGEIRASIRISCYRIVAQVLNALREEFCSADELVAAGSVSTVADINAGSVSTVADEPATPYSNSTSYPIVSHASTCDSLRAATTAKRGESKDNPCPRCTTSALEKSSDRLLRLQRDAHRRQQVAAKACSRLVDDSDLLVLLFEMLHVEVHDDLASSYQPRYSTSSGAGGGGRRGGGWNFDTALVALHRALNALREAHTLAPRLHQAALATSDKVQSQDQQERQQVLKHAGLVELICRARAAGSQGTTGVQNLEQGQGQEQEYRARDDVQSGTRLAALQWSRALFGWSAVTIETILLLADDPNESVSSQTRRALQQLRHKVLLPHNAANQNNTSINVSDSVVDSGAAAGDVGVSGGGGLRIMLDLVAVLSGLEGLLVSQLSKRCCAVQGAMQIVAEKIATLITPACLDIPAATAAFDKKHQSIPCASVSSPEKLSGSQSTAAAASGDARGTAAVATHWMPRAGLSPPVLSTLLRLVKRLAPPAELAPVPKSGGGGGGGRGGDASDVGLNLLLFQTTTLMDGTSRQEESRQHTAGGITATTTAASSSHSYRTANATTTTVATDTGSASRKPIIRAAAEITAKALQLHCVFSSHMLERNLARSNSTTSAATSQTSVTRAGEHILYPTAPTAAAAAMDEVWVRGMDLVPNLLGWLALPEKAVRENVGFALALLCNRQCYTLKPADQVVSTSAKPTIGDVSSPTADFRPPPATLSPRGAASTAEEVTDHSLSDEDFRASLCRKLVHKLQPIKDKACVVSYSDTQNSALSTAPSSTPNTATPTEGVHGGLMSSAAALRCLCCIVESECKGEGVLPHSGQASLSDSQLASDGQHRQQQHQHRRTARQHEALRLRRTVLDCVLDILSMEGLSAEGLSAGSTASLGAGAAAAASSSSCTNTNRVQIKAGGNAGASLEACVVLTVALECLSALASKGLIQHDPNNQGANKQGASSVVDTDAVVDADAEAHRLLSVVERHIRVASSSSTSRGGRDQDVAKQFVAAAAIDAASSIALGCSTKEPGAVYRMWHLLWESDATQWRHRDNTLLRFARAKALARLISGISDGVSTHVAEGVNEGVNRGGGKERGGDRGVLQWTVEAMVAAGIPSTVLEAARTFEATTARSFDATLSSSGHVATAAAGLVLLLDAVRRIDEDVLAAPAPLPSPPPLPWSSEESRASTHPAATAAASAPAGAGTQVAAKGAHAVTLLVLLTHLVPVESAEPTWCPVFPLPLLKHTLELLLLLLRESDAFVQDISCMGICRLHHIARSRTISSNVGDSGGRSLNDSDVSSTSSSSGTQQDAAKAPSAPAGQTLLNYVCKEVIATITRERRHHQPAGFAVAGTSAHSATRRSSSGSNTPAAGPGSGDTTAGVAGGAGGGGGTTAEEDPLLRAASAAAAELGVGISFRSEADQDRSHYNSSSSGGGGGSDIASTDYGVYSTVCKVAKKTGDPTVVFGVLAIVRRDPSFGLRETAALQAEYAPPQLRVPTAQLHRILPALFHAKFDPNTVARPVMQELWERLIQRGSSHSAAVVAEAPAAGNSGASASSSSSPSSTPTTAAAFPSASAPAAGLAGVVIDSGGDSGGDSGDGLGGGYRALLVRHQDAIVLYLCQQLGSAAWRDREAACLALESFLPQRAWLGCVRRRLDLLWNRGLRVLDDMRESTRAAALGFMKALASHMIRACGCNSGSIGGSSGSGRGALADNAAVEADAIDTILPLIFDKGLLAASAEARGFSLGVLGRVVDAAKNSPALRGWLGQLVSVLVEAMSALEPGTLQYMQFHTIRLRVGQEELEAMRVKMAQASPMQEALDTCLSCLISVAASTNRSSDGGSTQPGSRAGAGAGSGGTMESIAEVFGDVVHGLGAQLRRGVGLATRVAASQSLAQLAERYPLMLGAGAPGALPAVHAFKSLIAGLVDGGGGGSGGRMAATLRKAMTNAMGALAKVVAEDELGAEVAGLVQRYRGLKRDAAEQQESLVIAGCLQQIVQRAGSRLDGLDEMDGLQLQSATTSISSSTTSSSTTDKLDLSYFVLGGENYALKQDQQVHNNGHDHVRRLLRQQQGLWSRLLCCAYVGSFDREDESRALWSSTWNEALTGSGAGTKLRALLRTFPALLHAVWTMLGDQSWHRRTQAVQLFQDVVETLPKDMLLEQAQRFKRPVVLVLQVMLRSIPGPVWLGQATVLLAVSEFLAKCPSFLEPVIPTAAASTTTSASADAGIVDSDHTDIAVLNGGPEACVMLREMIPDPLQCDYMRSLGGAVTSRMDRPATAAIATTTVAAVNIGGGCMSLLGWSMVLLQEASRRRTQLLSETAEGEYRLAAAHALCKLPWTVFHPQQRAQPVSEAGTATGGASVAAPRRADVGGDRDRDRARQAAARVVVQQLVPTLCRYAAIPPYSALSLEEMRSQHQQQHGGGGGAGDSTPTTRSASTTRSRREQEKDKRRRIMGSSAALFGVRYQLSSAGDSSRASQQQPQDEEQEDEGQGQRQGENDQQSQDAVAQCCSGTVASAESSQTSVAGAASDQGEMEHAEQVAGAANLAVSSKPASASTETAATAETDVAAAAAASLEVAEVVRTPQQWSGMRVRDPAYRMFYIDALCRAWPCAALVSAPAPISTITTTAVLEPRYTGSFSMADSGEPYPDPSAVAPPTDPAQLPVGAPDAQSAVPAILAWATHIQSYEAWSVRRAAVQLAGVIAGGTPLAPADIDSLLSGIAQALAERKFTKVRVEALRALERLVSGPNRGQVEDVSGPFREPARALIRTASVDSQPSILEAVAKVQNAWLS